MSKPFTKIEPNEIKQLGSDTLVRLLHRLLHCEALAMVAKIFDTQKQLRI